MLRVEHLEARYGDTQVLFGISLDVHEGELVALVGANAAGKTTTLSAIAGIHPTSAGLVSFYGKEVTNWLADRMVELGVVYVPEGRRLFPRMSVRQNLVLGAYNSRARQHLRETMEEVFTLFPILRERQDQLAGTLSGGEQQMCAIARGLMAKPQLLMLDELSLGLAPIVVQRLLETVRAIRDGGTTILLVEQNVRAALQVADRAYVLQNGRLVMAGQSKDLLADTQLRVAYLGM